MATVVVVGSYGVGLTVVLDRSPDAGETVMGHAFSAGPGGKGSNQAVAAARLGARTRLCTVVGTDQYGQAALQMWDGEGVDRTLVSTIPGTTMIGVILVEANGENRIAIVPGVLSEFATTHLDGLESALADADVLLVGLEIPIATALAALRLGRRMGIRTVLNPAPAPTEPLPAEMLALVDYLTPNRTEAAVLAGLSAATDPELLVRADAFAAVPTIALTLGSEGVLLREGDEVSRIPAEEVSVVDSTGAGDAFNGAFAMQLGMGHTPLEAARFGVRAAGLSVTRAEVIPSLPYAADLVTSTTHSSESGSE